MYVFVAMYCLENNDTITTTPHHHHSQPPCGQSLCTLSIGTIWFLDIFIWQLIKSMYVKLVNTGSIFCEYGGVSKQGTLYFKTIWKIKGWLSS